MSTDEARDELSRAVQELRDLLRQPSATCYIQIGSIATGDITADPIVRSTRRPDYVYLDDIEITRDPASTGPSQRVLLDAFGEVEQTIEEHVVDENGRCAACEGRSGGRNWASEINARSGRDTELQAERYRAYQRAEEADMQIMRQEDAEWGEVRARQIRGDKIPEREVRFSWLHGPEVE